MDSNFQFPDIVEGSFSGHSQRGSVADPKVCRLAAGGKRIRTTGPSRKRVVSPTEREMPREQKGESRQRQLSFGGAPNVRTRLPPPARLTRVTEHSLRRLLKDFELFGFAGRNSKSSPYNVYFRNEIERKKLWRKVREDPIGKLKSRNSRNLKRKLLCLCRCSRRSAVLRGLKEAASCLGDSVPPLDSDPASATPS